MQDITSNQSLPKPSLSPEIFRQRLINHILMMRLHDVEYARSAAKYYATELPWLDIYQGLREAIEATEVQDLQNTVHTS